MGKWTDGKMNGWMKGWGKGCNRTDGLAFRLFSIHSFHRLIFNTVFSVHRRAAFSALAIFLLYQRDLRPYKMLSMYLMIGPS